ncbi:hypothetical protein HZA97_03210 [Candidatus Woesearchaeota archaeon]|nr:hypothetical protein [Candidatus Woesearchaeota archaeon]
MGQLLSDLWAFLNERKKWWLLPIILMLVFVGILIIFGQSSAVSPFIYALF